MRHVLTISGVTTVVLSLSDPDLGIGPGNAQVAAVVTGSTGVVVEKTTYCANASTFGATDTMPAWPLISGFTYLWAQEFF